MFDQPVKTVMRRHKVVKAPPETLIFKAARLMAKKNSGAVLVVEGDHLVGICTERDIVFRVVAQGLDPQTSRLADVMTPAPETVSPDKPFGYVLVRMYEQGFRHMPVVDGGKVVGIVSSRSAMDPSLEEFVSEAQRRIYFRGKA